MKDAPIYLEKLDRLIEEALQRPRDERTAFLRVACGDNPGLYNEVVSLLETFDEAEHALGDSAVEYAAPVLEADEVLKADEREAHDADSGLTEQIGPYCLLRELGRGGMGTVFLAERTDGVHNQPVALKLVNVGLAPTFVARFRAERQILGSLNHPGIARLLDGGEAEDGRPYLVMEYVPGEPITTYADRHRLTVDQRLDLFGQVCEAVAYAHRNLVVHRDLKPSNVLVTEDADGGRSVKLLDFGIAKLLNDESASGLTTTVGPRMMTPDYAAPEQVRGEAVTTSTDVYALGVLLYRLLTGHRPYRITHRTRRAVEEAILSAKHIEPSVVVVQTEEWAHTDGTTTTITPTDVSTARSSEVQRLRRRLHGDLDTIVLKALRKEPERRYGSAEALGRDLSRHLNGHPVEARPDRMGYRIGKFVQRHRVGVGAALLVFLALVLGLGLTLWQSGERAREAARADTARDFALSLFEFDDQELGGGEPLTTADLLDQCAELALDVLNV
ncbi:MAG: serine/threonine protein kinase [Rhodothermaceae bacterium]|nr:serine/threonine protein kinase [Rhodothermaceae bacterium]